MSYDQMLVNLKSAMATDAFNNFVKVESSRVSVQDVSDCPCLDMSKDALMFETTEDYLQDAFHEMLMGELNEFAS